MKIGQGYDIHRLVEGRLLVIGGVKIPHNKGFLAHSDGDVLTHAIIDALLGAMGEYDIGTFFPDNDPKYKDANSLELLAKTVAMVKNKGYEISNIDTTVIAQAPKLAPHIDAIKASLKAVLGDVQISVKAKTNEGLDEIGKGEAISAHAITLLFNGF